MERIKIDSLVFGSQQGIVFCFQIYVQTYLFLYMVLQGLDFPPHTLRKWRLASVLLLKLKDTLQFLLGCRSGNARTFQHLSSQQGRTWMNGRKKKRILFSSSGRGTKVGQAGYSGSMINFRPRRRWLKFPLAISTEFDSLLISDHRLIINK